MGITRWDKFEVIRDDGRRSARWYHWIGMAILGFVAGVAAALYLGLGGRSRRTHGLGVRQNLEHATPEAIGGVILAFGVLGSILFLIGFAMVTIQSAEREKRRKREDAERRAAAKMYD